MSLVKEAMESADVCLKYYDRHPEVAVFTTQIRTVQPSLDRKEFELTLAKRLLSVENLAIRVGKEQLFCNDQIHMHFRIQKADKKTVWLADVSEELADALETASEGENQFESDKTFLVQRLKNWYRDLGDRIKIPDTDPDVPVCFHPEIPVSENQRAAVTTALTSPFSYVWGAPGTGKTRHVLATCIYSCLKAGKKVLLTAPTNVALDQSLSGVLQALGSDAELDILRHVLRLGVADENFLYQSVCEEAVYERIMRETRKKISELLETIVALNKSRDIKRGKQTGRDPFPELTLKQAGDKINQLNRMLEDLKAKRDKADEMKSLIPFIDDFDIIAATADTCVRCVRPDGVFKPDHVFLDEAGYCSVIKGMTFTAYNCPLTMLGDHMQLPPVCDVTPGVGDDISKAEEGKLFLWKFSAIAMEQVIRAADYSAFYTKNDLDPVYDRLRKSSLVETHRFGPRLAGILADTVYDSSFTSRSRRETRIWVIDAPKRREDIGRNPQTDKPIRFSQSEEDAILRLILNNIDSGIIGEIGILTPYTEHRSRLWKDLGQALRKHHYQNVVRDNILSIHQSQGSEWDVVVISVVDSLVPAGLGTDAYMMRVGGASNAVKTINTAVSRAKQLLILLCDVESWQRSPNQFISKIIGIAERHTTEDPLPVVADKRKAEELPEGQTEEKESATAALKEAPAEDAAVPAPKVSGLIDKSAGQVLFGSYPQDADGGSRPIHWKILAEKEGSILLISDRCLDVRPFGGKGHSSYWGKSFIRKWLNADFLARAFTPEQRKAICPTTVDNSAAQSDTSESLLDGFPTNDQVFLLSYAEARQYFPDSRSRAATPTAYALSQLPSEGKKGENPLAGSGNRWLLRNNSRFNYTVSVVDSAGYLGHRCGVKSRRMVRPAIWVDQSCLAEEGITGCVVCGAKGKGLICPDCLNGEALDRLISRLEGTPFEEMQNSFPGIADKSTFYCLAEEQLPSPWKEYCRLIALSSGRYYIGRDTIKEALGLCDRIRQCGSVSDRYAANRIGGLLLSARTFSHDYSEADRIAEKLFSRANLPYQAYCSLIDFYLKTRRYTRAGECLARMSSEYDDNREAAPWIAKLQTNYGKRIKSQNFYKPRDKSDQDKLNGFLRSIGLI